jgi:hypothetical protein
MYELWLVLNILWEMALDAWLLLMLALLLWGLLMAAALRRPRPGWREARWAAMGVGLAAAALAVLAVPPATQSSLANMGYWVDWANLLAIAAAIGAVALAFAWPLLALRRG